MLDRPAGDELDDDDEVVDTSGRVDPAEQADRSAVRDRVKLALAELPPRLRTVLIIKSSLSPARVISTRSKFVTAVAAA